MIELADEIGREHIRALEDYFTALRSGTPLIVCVLYDDNDAKMHERLRELGSSIVDIEPTPMLIYIPSLVWDTLRSHGLLNNFPPKTIPTKVELPDATMVIDGTLIGSTRGEDLLRRKCLTWMLSRFSAKVNRWLALAVLIIWPAVVIGLESAVRYFVDVW